MFDALGNADVAKRVLRCLRDGNARQELYTVYSTQLNSLCKVVRKKLRRGPAARECTYPVETAGSRSEADRVRCSSSVHRVRCSSSVHTKRQEAQRQQHSVKLKF